MPAKPPGFHPPLPACLTSLNAYQSLADAWEAGVADWCRAASAHVLAGGRAWMIAASEGQANWIKRRLLCEGASLFGVEFLDARALRQELCLRLGLAAPEMGRETLDFLLSVRALGSDDPDAPPVARQPGACLNALDDLAASGWLDHSAAPDDLLSPFVWDALPALRASGFWLPHIDRQLRKISARPSKANDSSPLSVCLMGWDASRWPLFDLLLAALRASDSAYAYLPLPRGTSDGLQQAWLTALEEALEMEVDYCQSSGFRSAQATLAGRLEGTDLDDGSPITKPEFLAGTDWMDTVILTRDFIARWLLSNKEDIRTDASAPDKGGEDEDRCESARLVILCPRRTASAVALVRVLGEAGIAVEDELGELPEPTLPIQIQRAILDYHLNNAGLAPLLTLIELLNEHATRWTGHGARVLRAVCPLEPVGVRRALHGAFADLQHHDARVLSAADALAHTSAAGPLRELIVHLGTWPETLEWHEALGRWERCLEGLGLSAEVLEPLWTRIGKLPISEPVPSEAFFRYLSGILACTPARRAPEGAHRFARVVITTLAGAAGQIWGGALFLDSNEGAWPLYPSENPFLDDAERTRLNERRAENSLDGDCPTCGHLLTSAERAQLEQFQFFEILENCTGPLAFAGAAHDPAEPSKELYPNEWALRCLVESERDTAPDEEKLLDRWRRGVRQVERPAHPLPKAEHDHLQAVFARRRDPDAPFDGYCFNFEELTDPDELPWADAWSVRDLDDAWNRPATFALKHLFGVEPHRDGGRGLARAEGWAVGRMVHRWVNVALDSPKEPRQFSPQDWQRAMTAGLGRARAQFERKLHGTLPDGAEEIPLWWQGVMRKAAWAARRCLGTLAEAATDENANNGTVTSWVCVDRTLQAELKTAQGPLRLRAHCDALLLDGAKLAGAACQIIDIRTGGQPGAAPSVAQMERGHGLGFAALLFLALAEGVEPDKTRVGVVHPESVSEVASLNGAAAHALTPVLERIAQRQRSLIFGQRGPLAAGFGYDVTENLPLATTAIDPAILEAKAGLIHT